MSKKLITSEANSDWKGADGLAIQVEEMGFSL
jgi:hypothetical protein